MRILATCPRGTADLAADECRALGLAIAGVAPDGVALDLDRTGIAKALVWLRIPSRLLLELGRFRAATQDELYAGARALPWLDHFDDRATFAVFASGDLVPSTPERRGLDHHLFVAQKVKDALCDTLVTRFGRRPNVDRDDPDVRVTVRGQRGKWTVALDVSHPPLHERGFRVAQTEAPLKENLAAGVATVAGWRLDSGLLCDPMCGSATLVIEAVNLALGIAPGCTRRFGIERFPFASDKLRQALDDERAAAVDQARRTLAAIDRPVAQASDLDPAAVKAARKNLHAAGLAHAVDLRHADARALPLPPRSTILSNVPYGERLGGVEVTDLYRDLGRSWQGVPAWILCGHEGFVDAFGAARTTAARSFWNGPLPVTLWRCST